MAEAVHFASLFSIGAKGAAVVVQDSPEDKTACVYRVAVCPVGFRDDLPEFGVANLRFQPVPLHLADLESQIRRWEPRVELQASEQVEALNEAVQAVVEIS